MNNLLKSIQGNLQVDQDADLKSLFSGVRELRAQDVKSSDQFYDALEGLLNELRMVTMDNRDAEAFLKPVSRSEVPDYFDVITNPMDLHTMIKKVKTKSYKSKLEFQDDLSLVWDNCLRYNSSPDHPLRACALRLRSKANILLSRVTDRVERVHPRGPFAGSLPSPPSSNEDHPLVNGIIHSKPRLPLINGRSILKQRTGSGTPSSIATPPIKIPPSRSISPSKPPSGTGTPVFSAQSIPFPERLAIVRTPQSMALFTELDRQLDALLSPSPSSAANVTVGSPKNTLPMEPLFSSRGTVQNLTHRLKGLTGASAEREADASREAFRTLRARMLGIGTGTRDGPIVVPETPMEESHPGTHAHSIGGLSELSDGSLKRKRSSSSDDLILLDVKKVRVEQQSRQVSVKHEPVDEEDLLELDVELEPFKREVKLQPTELDANALRDWEPDPLDAVLDLWWKAVGTSGMMGGGVPCLRQMPKEDVTGGKGKGRGKRKRDSNVMDVDGVGGMKKARTRSKAKTAKKNNDAKSKPPDTSLNTLMNNNMATLRRMRAANVKYAQLVQDQDQKEAADSDDMLVGEKDTIQKSIVGGGGDIKLRERPWKLSNGRGGEVSEPEARGCYEWMCEKVLDHSSFQGTSSVALQTLTDLAVDYMANLGNSLRLLMDKFSQKMTSEELILHTLFESGTTSVSSLEYYIKDEIVRHGTRLQELEKKTNSALQEIIYADAVDDDAVFGDEADEDNFSSNMFGDLLGEDYLGLEASGIMREVGLSNLTIPKRLWKGKKKSEPGPGKGRENEPELPFPPPPPFVPLQSNKVDNQIGLMQGFYRDRFTALTNPAAAHDLHLPGTHSMSIPIPFIAVQPPLSPGPGAHSVPPPPPPIPIETMLAPPNTLPPSRSLLSPAAAVVSLLDDVPEGVHTKMGPLGQISVPNTAAADKKKVKTVEKDKDKPPGGAGAGGKGTGAKKGAPAKDKDKDAATTTPSAGAAKKKGPKTLAVANGDGAGGGSSTPNGSPTKKTLGPKGPGKGGSSGSPQKANGMTLVPPV